MFPSKGSRRLVVCLQLLLRLLVLLLLLLLLLVLLLLLTNAVPLLPPLLAILPPLLASLPRATTSAKSLLLFRPVLLLLCLPSPAAGPKGIVRISSSPHIGKRDDLDQQRHSADQHRGSGISAEPRSSGTTESRASVTRLPEEKGSRSNSLRQKEKGEKKQNRVSMLLDRLAPRSSSSLSSRSSSEADDFVISEPTKFQHRAHGETGLSTLVTHGEDPPPAKVVIQPPEQPVLKRAIALYPFTAAFENEISLEAGELVLYFAEQDDPDWWKGANTKHQFGWFPRNLILLQ
jgi:hypothetical protein